MGTAASIANVTTQVQETSGADMQAFVDALPEETRNKLVDAMATPQEIAINAVAAVYRGKVKDQAGALQMDAYVNSVQETFLANKDDKAKGFVKVVRTVCKTEWDYECIVVWATHGDFLAYKSSELRTEINVVFAEKAKPLLTDFYTGVRVYDRLAGEVTEGGGPKLATEGEIPVNKVCRFYRGNVEDEGHAVLLDAHLAELQAKLAAGKDDKTKGYVKVVRCFCKLEWEFEALVVWNSFEEFQAYKDSETRKEINGVFEENSTGFITNFYSGVRVYDEI